MVELRYLPSHPSNYHPPSLHHDNHDDRLRGRQNDQPPRNLRGEPHVGLDSDRQSDGKHRPQDLCLGRCFAIAKYSCAATKTAAINSYALAPELRDPVVEYMKLSPFSLAIDGSSDTGT